MKNIDYECKKQIAKEISSSLQILDPVVCEDGAAPIDNLRKIKKVHFFQKALIFLKTNTTAMSVEKKIDCEDCFKYPDTRPLLELLGEFTVETAGKINDFIGKVLVDVTMDLRSLTGGVEYEEYRKALDFNIARLNLTW